MSFAACHYNAVWSKPITVQPHLTRSNKACGAAGRVIHLISTEGMTRNSQDHLHIQAQACTASHSHVGQEEISEAEELDAIIAAW